MQMETICRSLHYGEGSSFWISGRAGALPCREELPHVEQAAKDYADRGVVVIGINLDRN